MKTDSFQTGMLTATSFLPQLAEALQALELVWPPLERVELCAEADSASLLVLLDFGDEDNAIHQMPRLRALCTQVEGRLLAPLELPAHRAQHTVRVRGSVVADVIGKMWARIPSPTRLTFSSEAELLAAWAKQVAEGGLVIDGPSKASVTFVTPHAEYAGNRATRLPDGRVEVAAGRELTRLLNRVANDLRHPRYSPAPSPPRRPHGELELRFERPRELAAAYANELSQGTLEVPVDDAAELQSPVIVRLTLPSEEVVILQGEVVAVSRDIAKLKLLNVSPATFEPIERLLEVERGRRPRVLVVDDEAIWRSTLVRMLKDLNADIILANDGREGLVKLTDSYFELDLVILDLHMPELDGRTVLDRIRRLGGDSAMRVLLFSATSREELEQIGGTDLVSAVFSKVDPLDRLRNHVARVLALESSASPAV